MFRTHEEVDLDCACAFETDFEQVIQRAAKIIWTAPVRSKRTTKHIQSASKSGLGLRLYCRNVLRARAIAREKVGSVCICAVETHIGTPGQSGAL